MIRTLCFILLTLIIMIVAIVTVGTAYAQTDTRVPVAPILEVLMPYILAALGTIITAILGWAAAAFQRWTNIKIEAQHREALHSALMTGATAAAAKYGPRVGELSIDVRSKIARDAIIWAVKSVPEALAYFKIAPEQDYDKLKTMAESKVGILSEAPAVPVTPANV